MFLTSCSTIKQLEIFSKPIERQPLALEDPVLPKLEDIKWYIITSENAKEVLIDQYKKVNCIIDRSMRKVNFIINQVEFA